MSEKLRANTPEVDQAMTVEVKRPAVAERSATDQTEQLEQAKRAVESSRIENTAVTKSEAVDDRPHLIDNAVKHLRLSQNLATVQSRLKPLERPFSRFIHQPLVSKVSAVSAQTVARPSGMLGGSITAFTGSLAYLYLAHHIGFAYNYALFAVFFVGGFVLGLAGEYAAYWLRRN